jgi:hypothetical protein
VRVCLLLPGGYDLAAQDFLHYLIQLSESSPVFLFGHFAGLSAAPIPPPSRSTPVGFTNPHTGTMWEGSLLCEGVVTFLSWF